MKKTIFKIGILQSTLFCLNGLYAQEKDSLKTSKIDEVVVTAYGIKKEKKALGYVYQDIKGSTMVDARENNVTDALVGKVTGLQLVKSSAGPAASSKIILRGFNSLTGDNQPLIVVDGTPMSNFTGASNNDFWNPTMDMGNGLSDLNPEDIENITVLKGGAASALYGSRAGNGVIMITTKTGKKSKGAGIVFSNTLNVQTLFMVPQVQKQFSQGNAGKYVIDGGASWGEEINGQIVGNWDGKNIPLRSYDNFKTFFKPGITNNNTLTFQQAIGENTTLFSSVGYLNDNGMIPETKYERLNITTRATSKFGRNNRWFTDIKVQYINSFAKNRPVGGENPNNYYGNILTLPTTVNLADFQEGMDVLGAKQYWYIKDGNNPYWSVNNRLNQDVRNRFFLNGNIRYSFADWINFDLKVGSDLYNTKAEQKVYTGGNVANSYSTSFNKSVENNYIASLNLKKDNLFGKWSGAASVFGQIMTYNYNDSSIGGSLAVPNYFTVTNIVNRQPDVSEARIRKQVNSAFATFDINYDNFWFLGATYRNDWSSTLSKENRSFSYYSANTSLVVTDMFKKIWDKELLGRFITFAKIRASYAQTGNGLGFNELLNYFRTEQSVYPNNTASNFSSILYNSAVTAEILKTFETGVNLRFYDRIDLDVNYYNTHATNQLINLPMNPLSGYVARKINAGDIGNKGIEVILNADIIRKQNFRWNLNVNFSKNENKIYELTDDVNIYNIIGFDKIGVVAYTGQRYGVIIGTKYARVEDSSSPYFGQKILDGQGLPTSDGKQYVLGDQTPRALLGLTSGFTIKNFGFSFQIDGRFGGKFFSGTMLALKGAGLAKETVVDGGRNSFIVDGVVPNGNGGYTVNGTAVTPQDYWTAVSSRSSNLGINEENIYDATNVRIRNVQLSYNFPKTLFTNTAFQSAKISFSINNLLMLYSKVKGVDPESASAVNTNATGYEYLSFPTSRNFVFNLTVGF
ncbi:SusC/RagA family TonB-linked outer membrane protein [Chryseobacterium sp. SIMBA_038]|uniref:SusC/RagA family TonB-linked outer membrane protein n=2 Tax=Pseudomonadati TaxID=3379134 RepID=UPI00397A4316